MSERKAFLQSEAWLQFQKATGRKVVRFSDADFSANGIIHTLPIVGRYLYVPRGPIVENAKYQMPTIRDSVERLILLAQEKSCRWIRIEPETEEALEAVKKSTSYKVVKAPHDMQPREILVMDITASEGELLSQMKGKTRYNIRLAEKRGVKVFETREEKYIQAFLDLITATSERKGIMSHPKKYYQQFFQTLPENMCRLFVAEYDGIVVAANIVMMYGGMATYVHGGTANVHRDVMAPYLLQWEQIKTAKKEGYHSYDFGGIKSENTGLSWQGITTFKRGFSPETASTVFPGTYDIILTSSYYYLYNVLQNLKRLKNIF